MKKLLPVLIFCFFSYLYAADFSFNGIKFGSEKGSFQEVKQITFNELNFRNIAYKYEDNKLVEVTAELSGKNNSMVRLADFINIIQNKYEMDNMMYLQSGGDIIHLSDKNGNTVNVIISEVDNEDCDAKLDEAKLIFTSNISSITQSIMKF